MSDLNQNKKRYKYKFIEDPEQTEIYADTNDEASLTYLELKGEYQGKLELTDTIYNQTTMHDVSLTFAEYNK